MRILILGGTVFLSRRITELALERGHDVTCLARGSVSAPPERAAFVQADRDGDNPYAGIVGDWDAVVDVSWQPQQVEGALEALRGRTALWIYVSSCSVYSELGVPGADEKAKLLPAYDGGGAASGETYGEAKVACEQLCSQYMGDRALIARPGLICGPGDGSDRFGYWPARLARGGGVLAPAIQDAPTQTIDVDDLAAWLINAAERRLGGIFNTVGPSISFGELLDRTGSVAEFIGELHWTDVNWLKEQGVAYWAGPDSLPHWLPEGYEGFAVRSAAAAVKQGLELRSVEDTIRRVLEDERRRGLTRERKSGLSPATEERLLTLLSGAPGDAPAG